MFLRCFKIQVNVFQEGGLLSNARQGHNAAFFVFLSDVPPEIVQRLIILSVSRSARWMISFSV